jgi:plasmid stabilization system protein ParE
MADVVWSDRAAREVFNNLHWLRQNRGERRTLAVATQIRSAVSRAAAAPFGYVWVGSVYESLVALPNEVRRGMTQDHRYVIFYRYVEDTARLEVLSVCGAGQQPPTIEELRS